MNLSKIFKRQVDLVKPEELDFGITVIGCGGIGSWTVLALAKLGCQNITVVDYDKVKEHNTPSQFYTLAQVGKPKVEALAENIKLFTGTDILPIQRKYAEYYDGEYSPAKVIISAIDSLEERFKLWNTLMNSWIYNKDFDFYIDARMGGELLRILTVNPFDSYSLYAYQKAINSSAKPSPERCTGRSIVYNTFICGGIIASLVKKYAKKEEVNFSCTFDIVTQSIL